MSKVTRLKPRGSAKVSASSDHKELIVKAHNELLRVYAIIKVCEAAIRVDDLESVWVWDTLQPASEMMDAFCERLNSSDMPESLQGVSHAVWLAYGPFVVICSAIDDADENSLDRDFMGEALSMVAEKVQKQILALDHLSTAAGRGASHG